MIRKRIEKKAIETSLPKGKISVQFQKPVILLKPGSDTGKSVMQALQKRRSIREISDRELSIQMLSDLL